MSGMDGTEAKFEVEGLSIVGGAIMQFAGFTDSTLKKVFEDDMYENGESGLVGRLYYHTTLGGDVLWCEERKDGELQTMRAFHELDNTNFKIIGNIHEDKDMYKKWLNEK